MTTDKGTHTERKTVKQQVYLGGMCPRCEGMGQVTVDDAAWATLSLAGGAVAQQAVDLLEGHVTSNSGKRLDVEVDRGGKTYAMSFRRGVPGVFTDPKAGPLIAVKLHILTRKSLGGIETDLDGRALRGDGTVLPGLYAAGEAAGFGGGGVHGYRSLEGTFLGGCVFSGRAAGRAAAKAVG